MNIYRDIFNKKLLSKKLNKFNLDEIDNLKNKLEKIKKWKYSIENSDLDKTKEKHLQGKFLEDFFCYILGYEYQIGNKSWNLIQEQKTNIDATTPDAVLGFFKSDGVKDVRCVIELKDALTNLDKKQKRRGNTDSPVEQAFSYASKYERKCNWVIVSNFKEIRLYSSNTQSQYEQFFITDLADEENFKKFYYLLNIDNLISKNGYSTIDSLYENNLAEEKNITEAFYKDYKRLRLNLFEHAKIKNENEDELIIFEKCQKLMDRFIFIRFCESKELLPENTFKKVIEVSTNSFELSNTKVWNQLKALFESIDKGNTNLKINRFNGGLFATDEILDRLILEDEILIELSLLCDYDFETDLNVNILGHIFEQSISDIEEIKSEIRGDKIDKEKSKRKKDGIFYTPEYITRYIVESTIDNYLNKKRKLLNEDKLPELTEEDYDPKKYKPIKSKFTKNMQKHITFYEEYRKVICGIKILDAACGSGAFLNAAFDYLHTLRKEVDKNIEAFTKNISIYDVGLDMNRDILQNNLYGVDLNEESVEITKLSLWLKTANKNKPLTSLDSNILCGNSLICDELYAKDKAFNWNESFSNIIKNGGFDIILGNPPYVRHQRLAEIKPYLKNNYKIYSDKSDLYVYFFEKGIDLLADDGVLGFICANKYTKASYGKKLREYILNNCIIKEFIDFGDLDIFKGISAYPAIVILEKENNLKQRNINIFKYCLFKDIDINVKGYISENGTLYNQLNLDGEEWVFESTDYRKVYKSIEERHKNLEEILNTPQMGMITGKNDAFILTKDKADELISKDYKNKEIIIPFLSGKDVKPYITNTSQYIIFPYYSVGDELSLVSIEEYPYIQMYLENYKQELISRSSIKNKIENGSKQWYEYVSIKKDFSLDKTYIVYPDISNKNAFAISKGNFISNSLYFIEVDNPIPNLAILNSEFLNVVIKKIAPDCKGGYKRYQNPYIIKLPYINLNKYDEDILKNHVEQIESVIRDLNCKIEQFLIYLKHSYGLIKISNNMKTWYDLEYLDFISELKKKKIKLDMSSEFELMNLFEQNKSDVISKLNQKKEKELEINRYVYKLYNLSISDIEILKQ